MPEQSARTTTTVCALKNVSSLVKIPSGITGPRSGRVNEHIRELIMEKLDA